jgi:hypothetical protein
LVLDFLARTTFQAGDFTRASDGSCRLHPQLSRAVVATCRAPQSRLDVHVRCLRTTVLAPMLSPDGKRARGAGAQTPASPTSVHRRPSVPSAAPPTRPDPLGCGAVGEPV